MNRLTALHAGLALAGVTSLAAQTDDFQWRRTLTAGQTIEIVGVNGPIEAVGTGGREVEVRAVKTGRKSDPAEVRIEVVEHADGITICAVYPAPRRSPENSCRPKGKSRSNTRDNDVKVAWTLRIPAGVRFAGRTVNGDVTARDLSAPATGRSVNGSITIETSAWASATTVNGSISARMGSTDWEGDAEFETVNGAITLDLPANASMEVDASSVNGVMSTDFPLTIRGKWGPQRMHGSIGQGGRMLMLSSVNGDVSLRKSR